MTRSLRSLPRTPSSVTGVQPWEVRASIRLFLPRVVPFLGDCARQTSRCLDPSQLPGRAQRV